MNPGRCIVLLAMLLSSCGRELPSLPATAPVRLPFDGTFVGLKPDQRQRADARIAEVTSECMRSRGFIYVAETRNTVPRPGPPGWGISTGGARDESQQPVSANDLVFDAMTDEQKRAYEEALHGRHEDRLSFHSPDGGQVSFPPPESCLGKGNQAAFGDMGRILLAQEKILMTYRELEDRIDSDPRLVRVVRRWSRCLAGRGYRFSHPDDARDWIRSRFAALSRGAENSEALKRLQQDEIRLHERATACDHSVGLSEFRRRVRAAYEIPFARANAALVADLTVPAA